jgi:predicted DNA-binding transcriptional regulator AlpA
METGMAEALLTAKEVMERIGVKRSTWYASSWIQGFFRPRAIHTSEGKKLWRESAVTLYLAKQEGRVA